jgi:hypothetical protein
LPLLLLPIHADNGSFQPFCHSPSIDCAVGNEYPASNYIYFADRSGFFSLFFVNVRIDKFKNRKEAILSTQVQKRDSIGYLSGDGLPRHRCNIAPWKVGGQVKQ